MSEEISTNTNGPGTPATWTQAAGTRQTNPSYEHQTQQYLTLGGQNLGLIPHKLDDMAGYLRPTSVFEHVGILSPLRMLARLIDIDPALSFAVSNVILLTTGAGDSRIVAEKASSSISGKLTAPASKVGDESFDAEGTAAIENLWDSLPPEVGGYDGIMKSLTLLVLCTGLPMVEAVPGKRGKGCTGVYPVDSLTVRFGRKSPNARIRTYQRQAWLKQGTNNGWKEITSPGFFYKPVDAWPDDPNGRSLYSPSVAESLNDLKLMQDVRDAVHNAAWPRGKYGFNFSESHKQAVEIYKITDPLEAAKWVQNEFLLYKKYVDSLPPGASIITDTNGTYESVDGGNFQGMSDVLAFLRQRKGQSVKAWPSILGINDGATQTYTSVEWAMYAAGLEAVRGYVMYLLAKVANFHLRLLGMSSTAKSVTKPIRKTDAQADATTEQIEIGNAAFMRDQGWITQDEASIRVTGTGAVGPAPPIGTVSLGGSSGNQVGQPTKPNAGGENSGQGPQGNNNKGAGSKPAG